MRQLLPRSIDHRNPDGHAVKPLVHRAWRYAAAVVDVAGDTGGLVKALPLQPYSRRVAVIAWLAVVASGKVGMNQPPAFDEALNILHTDIVGRLLEHEQPIV